MISESVGIVRERSFRWFTNYRNEVWNQAIDQIYKLMVDRLRILNNLQTYGQAKGGTVQ